MDQRVNWDKDSTRIFCEICKEECEQGNRPLGFLSTARFRNLEDKFNRTGRRLSKRQLKNKWDQLKKDYGQWHKLKNSATGLGWNDHRGTIDTDDAWWTAHLQRFPKHAKYRFGRPDHLNELEVMFDKAIVTGALSTAPGPIDLTAGLEPEEVEDDVPQPTDLGGTSEPTKLTQDKGKRRRSTSSNPEGSAYFHAYKQVLDKWATTTETSSVGGHGSTPTIAQCMAMMRELGVQEASATFVRTCKMLKDADNRQIFCNLQSDKGKMAFLYDGTTE